MVRRERVGDLVGLIDRLEDLMMRSALAEVEVEVGDTTLILRSPAAVAPASGAGPTLTALPQGVGTHLEPEPEADTGHRVLAPLTGVFYLSPSPGAEPYIREGVQVNTGQVIGLIEAMKLFNEIKSDATGTVRRLLATDGDLVKAKQALIEVELS